MAKLNLGQDVAKKRERSVHIVANSYPLLQAALQFSYYHQLLCAISTDNFLFLLPLKGKLFFLRFKLNWRPDLGSILNTSILNYVFKSRTILSFKCKFWKVFSSCISNTFFRQYFVFKFFFKNVFYPSLLQTQDIAVGQLDKRKSS